MLTINGTMRPLGGPRPVAAVEPVPIYVRWRKRELTRTTVFHGRFGLGGHALSAVLVENARVAGRPRQRFVAHLATVRVWDGATGRGDVPVAGGGSAHRGDARDFWESVSRKLDSITAAFDRDAVEVRIAARVPRPLPGQCSIGSSSSASRAPSMSGSVCNARS